jgi:hypothetical protein
MHTAKSLKNKSYYISIYIYTHTYIYTKNKNSKICISMHFGFNNQFIKVMRTRPIFKKIQKNYFVFS